MTPGQIERGIAEHRGPATLRLWRAVEAQHVIATQPLVDTLAEQAELERILDEAKPSVPAAPRALHWLLSTPFRYPPLPMGSRFRGPGDPGVWYGAEEIRTACAELGYWRWRFLRASFDLTRLEARPQSVFHAELAGDAIDLREPPLATARTQWTHADDYSATQSFARIARRSGVELIRYESVRDPGHGGCAAALSMTAFAASPPGGLQTWLLEVRRDRAIWASTTALTVERFEFRFG